MASLREIKDHIGSVRSTLKITSAMKLVASAKLRKAQQAVEGIRPYSEALSEILTAAAGSAAAGFSSGSPVHAQGKVAIVGVSSNSSLCGAFNVNVIRKVQELAAEYNKQGNEVVVYSVGRKMAESMRKAGFPSADYSELVGRCSFDKASAFAQTLLDAYSNGLYDSVILVYNHFVSTSSQKVWVEEYLGGEDIVREPVAPTDDEYIFEPSRGEVLSTLKPLVMRLRIYTVLLDSIAAEHAARTVAMRAASDNAEDLLGSLTLEYNKGRQQKITAEILDLVGGAQQ